ncbi:hypothetical protein LCGC14_1196440 [marine sediment metagenome]|uniref:Uncharacterized protein n=1 Tax=marine sediment metagenome TaxID=412755 RepID=A0A0F9P0L4_9ZZZZ
MSRRYAGFGAVATTTGTPETLLNLISATTIRPHLYDIILGSDATADQAYSIEVERTTAVGTEGSGFTPTLLDPDSPVSLSDVGVGTYASEPTYTASSTLLGFGLNQRGTFRWVAAPGGELIAPATANAGLGIKAESSTANFNVDVTFHWEE